MNSLQRYWQLIRLHSAGGYRIETIPAVKDWFQGQFAPMLSSPLEHDQIQRRLVEIWQTDSQWASLAELSLRCCISHQIWQTCSGLVQQFGTAYPLQLDELLALVLDDVGQPVPKQATTGHCPFSLEILSTYDPTKAKLNTWTTRLVKHQTSVNRYLLDHGLYRASDWAILNDTSCEQLQRILSGYFGYRPNAISVACHRLDQYHRVYRQDRLRARQGCSRRLCLPPTERQLKRMAPTPPKETLNQLITLASQLRQYRIHVRRGTPYTIRTSDLGSSFSLENLSDPTNLNRLEWDDDHQELLRAYRSDLHECLQQAIAICIQARLDRLNRRCPADSMAYQKALALFHCEGMSMGQIAQHIGRQNQVQVTRLLQLSKLRNAVRDWVLPQLQTRVKAHCLQYVSAEQLELMAEQLNQVLAEEVDQMLQAYAREIQTGQGHRCSLFACQVRAVINRSGRSQNTPDRNPFVC